MDRLPAEIISNIVHHVEEGSLAPLSVLCRRWQPIVEAKIYRELHISYELPGGSPLSYEAIRNHSHKTLTNNLTPTRLSYIRQLHVVTTRYELDLAAQSTDIIRQLFDLLTRVPHNQEPLLSLYFNLRGDFRQPASWSSYSVESPPDGLPELPMVRSFQLRNYTERMGFSPRGLLYMASKMTRLRELNVTTFDFKSAHQKVELARSITKLPTSISKFSLQYRSSRYRQEDEPEGLLVTEDGESILTRELRRFSQREGLKVFSFSGCTELSIFWPPDSATSEPRHWPTLETFQIHFYYPQHLASLHATEFPDAAQDPDDSDGIVAYKGIMNASARVLAKCSACMPKAKFNYIYFGDTWNTYFTYRTMFPGDPCVIINGELDVELDEETVGEWRKTAEVHNLDLQIQIEEVTEEGTGEEETDEEEATE